MGPLGSIPRQLEHLRTERGDDPRGGVGGGTRPGRAVHGFQVPPHVLQGHSIRTAPRVGEEGMADPQAHHEPSRVGLGQGSARVRHGHGVPGPDAGDARRHHDPFAPREQDRRVGDGFLARGLAHPDRAEPELFQASNELLGPLSRLPLEMRAPYSDLADARCDLPGPGAHGDSRSARHAPGSLPVYRTRSCSRSSRPCQNSNASGRSTKPPQ